MPIHDWTKVPAGLFHHFHQEWTIEIGRALNRGRLPKGLNAFVEQRTGPYEADVLAIEGRDRLRSDHGFETGVVTMERPVTRIVRRTDATDYARRANRIVVRHHLGRIIAEIEVVSPGNKDSRAALRDFVEKTVQLMQKGVHILIVDLFPPTSRDPLGLHKVIWDEFIEEDFAFPPGKDRILASYQTGGERVAYVEPVAVGENLPDMPLFLTSEIHVKVPLEPAYQMAWEASPSALREAVENGIPPQAEE
jgi:hypothetical protein